MIDLTPLDVRNKRGDFKKLMRGYDPQEVDVFLEIVAERLEVLTRANMTLSERVQVLEQQVTSQLDRERAVQDALVSAQALGTEMKEQAQKEAAHLLREAETEVRRMLAEAEAEARTRIRGIERRVDAEKDALAGLERRRARFLQDFRRTLERELEAIEAEESRGPVAMTPDELRALRSPASSSRSAEVDPHDEGAEPASPDPVPAADAPMELQDDQPATAADVAAEAAPGPEDSAPAESDSSTSDPADGAPVAEAPPPPTESVPVSPPPLDDGPPPPEAAATRDAADGDVLPIDRLSPLAGGVAAIFDARDEPEGDGVDGVPRLEEVLAEAGGTLVDPAPGDDEPEIAPPQPSPPAQDALLLYLDPDESDAP